LGVVAEVIRSLPIEPEAQERVDRPRRYGDRLVDFGVSGLRRYAGLSYRAQTKRLRARALLLGHRHRSRNPRVNNPGGQILFEAAIGNSLNGSGRTGMS